MISYIIYDIIYDIIYAKLTLTSHKLPVLTHSDRVSESRIMISYMISYMLSQNIISYMISYKI